MSDTPNKKDLTGLHELGQIDPAKLPTQDPNFTATVMPTIDTIDEFESLNDLGMMDHAAEIKPEPVAEVSPEAPPAPEPTENFFAAAEIEPLPEPIIFQEPAPVLEKIKNYSEASKYVIEGAEIHYPFHFYAEGVFGFYERDKLLRFISENQIGITSSDIDLQIRSGKVFIPRISEYAAIRLVQVLRDTPLQLKVIPSDRDGDELTSQETPMHFQYEVQEKQKNNSSREILTIAIGSPDRSAYLEKGELQATQFLKAQMVEAEKSPLFQEVLSRMTESLKNKARFKGADAITQPVVQVVSLRLPSQYQIILTTTLLEKKINA